MHHAIIIHLTYAYPYILVYSPRFFRKKLSLFDSSYFDDATRPVSQKGWDAHNVFWVSFFTLFDIVRPLFPLLGMSDMTPRDHFCVNSKLFYSFNLTCTNKSRKNKVGRLRTHFWTSVMTDTGTLHDLLGSLVNDWFPLKCLFFS